MRAERASALLRRPLVAALLGARSTRTLGVSQLLKGAMTQKELAELLQAVPIGPVLLVELNRFAVAA